MCLELPLNTGHFLQITPLKQWNVFTLFPPVFNVILSLFQT